MLLMISSHTVRIVVNPLHNSRVLDPCLPIVLGFTAVYVQVSFKVGLYNAVVRGVINSLYLVSRTSVELMVQLNPFARDEFIVV